MHRKALGWRPGATAWSKVQIDSKTENLAPMKSMAKLHLISLRARHYFWSFLVPGKKKNCLMKDMLSPSSTDWTTSWRFGANLLENQLFPEKYPLSCWNSWPWCIGFLSVKARGWALCTIFWENNTRGFHWCQEESDGLLRECSLEVSQAKLPFKPGVHRLTFLLPPPYIFPCAPTYTSPAKLYTVCSIFPF